MFKKVKAFLDEVKRKNAQKKEMKSMQDYYEKLRAGALFVQYIYKDIETQKKKMNRHEKRRIDSELARKGKFSEEVIRRYMAQINDINVYFAEENEKLKKTIISSMVKKELEKAKKTNDE